MDFGSPFAFDADFAPVAIRSVVVVAVDYFLVGEAFGLALVGRRCLCSLASSVALLALDVLLKHAIER